MKILCAYSSIEFSCEHFPAILYSRETTHPIFQIPQKQLLSFLGKWAEGGLTQTDSYLLYLALLKSSDLVDFRVPAIRCDMTPSLVAQNLEPLAKALIKLNTVPNVQEYFPHYVISKDSRDLTNTSFWISNWENSYSEWKSGKFKDYDGRELYKKLAHREAALERLIKNPHRPVSAYASQIADWAEIAGSFPQSQTLSPFSNSNIPLGLYWKQIILRCAKEDHVYSIRRADLEELLEHCEEQIPVGTLYSNTLFKLLRFALEKQKNFLGFPELAPGKSISYSFLQSSDTVEAANLRAAIAAAPSEEPKEQDFPSKILFLKAKFRWDMARKAKKADETDSEGEQE